MVVQKYMYSSNLPPNKHKNTAEYFVTWNIQFIKDGNEVPNEYFGNQQNPRSNFIKNFENNRTDMI